MGFADKFLFRSDRQRWLDAWELPPGEFIQGATYRADGWRYGDLPPLTYAEFREFVRTIGDDNLRWLSMATDKQYGIKRGQYIISPAGSIALDAHLARQKN